jgi:hypothetical protein
LTWHLPHSSQVEVSLYTIQGKHIGDAFNGTLQPGVQHIPISFDVSGTYVCSVIADGKKQFDQFVTVTR